MCRRGRTLGLLALWALSLTTGCSTYQMVTIESDPPGARIYVNGSPIGNAPVKKSLLVDAAGVDKKNRWHRIDAKLDCYIPETAVLQSDSVFWSNSKPYPETVTLKLTPDPRCASAPKPKKAERPSGKGLIGTGSGFAVTTDGLVVTNHHVIEGCSHVRVPPGDAVVVASNSYFDLAILRSSTAFPTRAVLRSGQGVRSGESVVVLGYPLRGILSSEPNVSTGIVSSLAGPKNDSRVFQMSAPIQPGNSGGPVLDASGHVVGVSVGTLTTLGLAEEIGTIPQNINFAINGGSLERFLRESGVDYRAEPSDEELTTADVATKARLYTVLVECWAGPPPSAATAAPLGGGASSTSAATGSAKLNGGFLGLKWGGPRTPDMVPYGAAPAEAAGEVLMRPSDRLAIGGVKVQTIVYRYLDGGLRMVGAQFDRSRFFEMLAHLKTEWGPPNGGQWQLEYKWISADGSTDARLALPGEGSEPAYLQLFDAVWERTRGSADRR